MTVLTYRPTKSAPSDNQHEEPAEIISLSRPMHCSGFQGSEKACLRCPAQHRIINQHKRLDARHSNDGDLLCVVRLENAAYTTRGGGWPGGSGIKRLITEVSNPGWGGVDGGVPIPALAIIRSSGPAAWPRSSCSQHRVLLTSPLLAQPWPRPMLCPAPPGPAPHRRPGPRAGAGSPAAYPVLQLRGELGLELAAGATAVVSLNEDLPGHRRLLRPHGEDRTGRAAGSGDTNHGHTPGLDSGPRPASPAVPPSAQSGPRPPGPTPLHPC